MKHLDHNGPPDAQSGDPKWMKQADLERLIADHYQGRLNKDQSAPVKSTVRGYAVAWLAELRASRMQADN